MIDYTDEQMNPALRRCRFIEHTADLSASRRRSAIQCNLLLVTLRWVETRQLLPLLRSRLPETWSVTPTQAATVVGEV